MLSLKYRGTLPLVEGVRLMALRHQVSTTSTLGRIAELATRGHMSRDEQDYLAGGYRHISHILMHRQIEHGGRAARSATTFRSPS